MTLDPLAPATLGPVRLRNRVVKAATFEGMTRRGLVTEALIDFHRTVAAGGVGMTTVAYCAVAPDGRAAPEQLVWRDEALPGLRTLTDAVHAEGAAVSAQVGHAGPVAPAFQLHTPALAASAKLSASSMGRTRAATREDIARIVGQHAQAARWAVECGFDAVELHFGHNYFVSSFLSPDLNDRDDEYGGSFENRARVARDTARAVRDAVGGRLAITAKLNMDDGARRGLHVDDAVAVAQLLERDGTLDALELTAGSSLRNPMFLFRGDVPLREFAAAMPPVIRPGVRLFGRALLKSYDYQPLYLLELARRVRAAVSMPLILLGGVTDRPGMDRAMAEGFQFVAMGRALLREPDLVNRIAAVASTPSLCTHCNKCMPTIYSGTHCVLVPPDRRPGKGMAWT
jgi:2,4-dienoyl-CoA reductase-like NADH-dependent reductase (Old Yellow Enzyme family)